MYHHFASDLSGHQLTVPFIYNIDQNYIYIYIYIYPPTRDWLSNIGSIKAPIRNRTRHVCN